MKFCSFDILNILKKLSTSSIPSIFIFIVHFLFLQTETFIFNFTFHFNLSGITICHQEVFYSKTNFSLLLNINNTKYYYIVLILFVWLNYIKLICIVAKILFDSHLLDGIITNTFHIFIYSIAHMHTRTIIVRYFFIPIYKNP